jgi:hypothetical protein
MARTKQTARKSEPGKTRPLVPAVLGDEDMVKVVNKRPRGEEDEDSAVSAPKKPRRDDGPTERFRLVIMEAAGEYELLAMNVVEGDRLGLKSVQDVLLECRELDELRQFCYTSEMLTLLAKGELQEACDSGDLGIGAWQSIAEKMADLVSKHHLSCVRTDTACNLKQDWMSNVDGVFWISNYY